MERYIRANVEDWTKVGARVNQVDSTNDSLREQVQAFAKTGHVLPEGYSLRADYQSSGKGRLGRIWDANPGENLLISYLLTSAGLRPDQLFLLLQNIAVAVRETVDSFTNHQQVQVKWPNDILIDGKKVAGILIESMLLGNEVSCVIVGIGINVNQTRFENQPNATSIALCNGNVLSIDAVVQSLTRKLQSAQAHLREIVGKGDVYSLQQQYHGHLFGLGEKIVFLNLKNEQEIIGKVIGVLSTGELRLDFDGKEHRFSLNDIRFIRKNTPL